MEILHNRATEFHNPVTEGEGSYRLIGFLETVSSEEIALLSGETTTAMQYTHSRRHFYKMRGACRSKCEIAEVCLDLKSFQAIMASATLAIMAAKRSDFAVTRPPGHHAIQEKAQGFCFFNNIAIGVNHLLQLGKRVCIVDIDGHHGNGTQAIFRRNDSVLFCSMHQKSAYPYTGPVTDIGKGPSFRKVINIPLIRGSGDDLFIASLEFLREYIKRFNPDVIAVSAGFDGYSKDKLLGLNYSKRGYFEAGKFFASLGRPVFAVLEGGYHEDVKACTSALVSGVSGNSFESEELLSVSPPECAMQHSETVQRLSKLLQ